MRASAIEWKLSRRKPDDLVYEAGRGRLAEKNLKPPGSLAKGHDMTQEDPTVMPARSVPCWARIVARATDTDSSR